MIISQCLLKLKTIKPESKTRICMEVSQSGKSTKTIINISNGHENTEVYENGVLVSQTSKSFKDGSRSESTGEIETPPGPHYIIMNDRNALKVSRISKEQKPNRERSCSIL